MTVDGVTYIDRVSGDFYELDTEQHIYLGRLLKQIIVVVIVVIAIMHSFVRSFKYPFINSSIPCVSLLFFHSYNDVLVYPFFSVKMKRNFLHHFYHLHQLVIIPTFPKYNGYLDCSLSIMYYHHHLRRRCHHHHHYFIIHSLIYAFTIAFLYNRYLIILVFSGGFESSSVKERTFGYYTGNFVGCLGNLSINEQSDVRFDDVSSGVNIQPCEWPCNNVLSKLTSLR